MQPFGGTLGTYYESILKAAIEQAGLTPIRADAEIVGTGKIMDQIWRGIRSATARDLGDAREMERATPRRATSSPGVEGLKAVRLGPFRRRNHDDAGARERLADGLLRWWELRHIEELEE
jgi:hypothetical protein